MEKKKITLSIIIAIIAMLLIIIPNRTNAETRYTDTPLYFGIQEYRRGTLPADLGYAINNPYGNGSTTESIVGTKIWQIVKHDNSDGTGTYTTGNYYCVRAGVGFNDTTKVAEYDISYDLKTERAKIAASDNTWLRKIANSEYYYNLLALTDLLYLQGKSTEAEREALLNAAGIPAGTYDYEIKDSDIEAAQQAAIWYYTNHDDAIFERVFNNYDEAFANGTGDLTKTSWLFYRTAQMERDG